MCTTECSARCHARRDGLVMWLVCNRARFPATRPRVFCELKIMKMVILIYQIIQEKFANGELFMLVMIEYIFMFKMVKKKMQNSVFRNSSWVNTSLNHLLAADVTCTRQVESFKFFIEILKIQISIVILGVNLKNAFKFSSNNLRIGSITLQKSLIFRNYYKFSTFVH